ncbi:MAG: PD40 domain-containing protein [Deltaproteobacteria bacterium]|nr:PD40 domain-containing protein [Deltaproteobacteria bacterium]MBI2974743.1 PD40 domain-containing protein [Deltaproteobacteria bacterium]
MKKYFFLVSCLMLLASSSFAASYDPSIKWRTLKTKHFSVHYDEKLDFQAKKAAEYFEEAHRRLSPKLDWEPWGRTEIILSDNNDSANGMTSTLPYNWILLRIASPEPDSVLADYDNWLRTLIMHEYTHVLHIDQCGGVMRVPRFVFGKVVGPNGSVPGWIREGIATYTETTESSRGRGRATYPEMLVRTAVLNDQFPGIDEVDGLAWKWPSYQSMYMYGVKFLQYLSDRFGEEKLMKFHKKMGRSPLLYMVNSQAKWTFNDIKFESKKVHTHYIKTNVKGLSGSKTFYDLWDEWQDSLEKKYAEKKKRLEAEGLSELETVASGETVSSSPAASKDGKYLAYARTRAKGPAEIHLVDLEKGVDRVVRKKQAATSISFSADGKKIAYSAMGSFKRYNYFSDIYTYEIETGKVEQLTKGARASDPVFSPDGKTILFVKQDGGASWLASYDMEKKEVADYRPADADQQKSFEQFAQPSWSPDGKWIAVSSWQPVKPTYPATTTSAGRQSTNVPTYESGQWDLYVIQSEKLKTQNAKFIKLTDDIAIDSHPIWSQDGKSIYFASDRSGINNIYKINMSRALEKAPVSVERITNVLTGAFQPAVSADGKTLYVQYYNGEGYDIRKTGIGGKWSVVSERRTEDNEKKPVMPTGKQESGNPEDVKEIPPPLLHGGHGAYAGMTDQGAINLENKKYSPFGKSLFLPRFVIPSVAVFDNAVFLGAFTGGMDPLRYHNWTGGINYRTDLTSYPGYFFNYWYNKYKPVVNAGVMAYSLKYSTIYNFGAYSKQLFEERIRGYGGVSYPFGKSAAGLFYFYEDRGSNLTTAEFNAAAGVNAAPQLGKYAGLLLSYAYGQVEKYPASISNEHGRRLKTNLILTDDKLGSNKKMEQGIFAGDYREYVNMPWFNHILALRTSGGITLGDNLAQGTFSLGGALGEGAFGGGDSLYYFPLRGLPIASLSATRVLLASAEYRIPLVSPQRGLGTTPFYLQNIHIAPFADYGNAWNAAANMWGEGKHFFDDFFLGTGLELRGDFILGHGLPITGRLGYSVIVVNRDRLGSIKDPLLGTSAKNGVMVLQLGTAF